MVARTIGGNVQVVVCVVKGKGDLGRLVNLAGGDAGLFLLRFQVLSCQNSFNVFFRQSRGGFRCLRKQRVADLQATVHDGDDHALALVAGGVLQAAQLGHGRGHIRGDLEDWGGVGRGHAGELANFFQLTIGDHGGEAVFHGGVAMENF